MKKLFFFGIWCLLTYTTTSCFELREQISLQPDGRGEYALYIDMSEHQQLLGRLVEETKRKNIEQGVEPASPLERIRADFQSRAEALSRMPGIGGATAIHEPDSFIFGVTFRFDNLRALNEGLGLLPEMRAQKGFQEPYRLKGKRFFRSDLFYLQPLVEGLEPGSRRPALPPEIAAETRQIYDQLRYRFVLEAPGGLRRVRNKAASMAADKQSFSIQLFVKELRTEKAPLGFKAKLR